MKIVFLNTWAGKLSASMAGFIKEQSADADVFCFQEAYDDVRQLARTVLPDYTELEKYKFVREDDNFPQATYVKKSIPIVSSGTILENRPETGLGLYAQIHAGGKNYYICNFHGMSQPGNKLDNAARMLQSESIIQFFKDKNSPVIIGGDFNLLPDTKSITMFREYGYKDLIKDYSITTTRNQLAWEMYPDSRQYYADYVFTSADIKIKNFSVPSLEISDHLPLILEIE